MTKNGLFSRGFGVFRPCFWPASCYFFVFAASTLAACSPLRATSASAGIHGGCVGRVNAYRLGAGMATFSPEDEFGDNRPPVETCRRDGMLQNTLHHFAGQAFFVLQLGHRENLSRPASYRFWRRTRSPRALRACCCSARWRSWPPFPRGRPVASRGGGSCDGLLHGGTGVCLAAPEFRRAAAQSVPRWGLLVHGFAKWAYGLRGLRDARITLLAVLMHFSRMPEGCGSRLHSTQPFPRPSFYAPFLIVAVLDLATMIPLRLAT